MPQWKAKIIVKIKGKPVELNLKQAVKLYEELDQWVGYGAIESWADDQWITDSILQKEDGNG